LMKSEIAASIMGGIAILTNVTSNVWAMSANISRGDGVMTVAAGYISLSGTLDRVRITTVNGTDTFDAGSINILYE
jgi:peptide methionine sulfoxide reductase MsrA